MNFPRIASFLVSLLLMVGVAPGFVEAEDEEVTSSAPPEFYRYDPIFAEDGDEELCDTYLAPSAGRGWGVYAGRDFEENEVVEVVPRFLALKNDWMATSVLDDYHYGYTFTLDEEESSFGAFILGRAMWFNHGHGDKQNVVYTSFGREPDREMPWSANALAYVTNRPVKRGEELLCSYGDGQWFIDRDIEMKEEPQKEIPTIEEIRKREEKHCSNVVAGIGHSTWTHRVVPAQKEVGHWLPDFDYLSRLPMQNHPTAIAKTSVSEGEVMEISPALVVPAATMAHSPLAPMTIFWDDLEESHKDSIRKLREMNAYRLKGISAEGSYEADMLEYFEDSSILPAAGNMAMVRKVGQDYPNCRIEIIAPADTEEELDMGSAGLVLKLIALREIQSGEELRLNLPDQSSWDAKMSLQQHLSLLGQPIPRHLVETFNSDIKTIPEDEEYDEEEGEEEL